MTSTQSSKPVVSIDARGPRFSASLTVIVLAIALVTSNVWVIAFQAAVFAIGAIRGPQFTPYAFIFKKVVKSRLKSPPTFEDVRPPRFAQAVGLGFAVVALIGSVTGSDVLFSIAVSFALAAAFLNAAFNYCLGCQMYLLLVRATTK
jgi:hypothetical protein